ncbi:MAG: nucleotide exchange factor GrpE [Christensenellales bacterium]
MPNKEEKKVSDKKVDIAEEKTEETIVSKEAEYLELAQRIKAEFENYKKRNAEISSQSFDNGVMTAIEKMLPAMDSFKQAKESISDENTLKGLDLVLNQILKAFDELGVTKIKAVGEQFNPNFHNAVLTGNNPDKPNGEILSEYQEGFIFKNDKVIRHSVVQINKLDNENE